MTLIPSWGACSTAFHEEMFPNVQLNFPWPNFRPFSLILSPVIWEKGQIPTLLPQSVNGATPICSHLMLECNSHEALRRVCYELYAQLVNDFIKKLPPFSFWKCWTSLRTLKYGGLVLFVLFFFFFFSFSLLKFF